MSTKKKKSVKKKSLKQARTEHLKALKAKAKKLKKKKSKLNKSIAKKESALIELDKTIKFKGTMLESLNEDINTSKNSAEAPHKTEIIEEIASEPIVEDKTDDTVK